MMFVRFEGNENCMKKAEHWSGWRWWLSACKRRGFLTLRLRRPSSCVYLRGRTCCESVSFLTPLRDKHGDLPVASLPECLHGQSDATTGEEPMKAMTAEKTEKRSTVRRRRRNFCLWSNNLSWDTDLNKRNVEKELNVREIAVMWLQNGSFPKIERKLTALGSRNKAWS